jgi:hypothetical protein
MRLCDLSGGGGEAIGQPAFGGSESGSGADADDRHGDTPNCEALAAARGGGGRAFEANVVNWREGFDNAGAAKQFEIVEALMGGNVTAGGRWDGLGEQEAAAIAVVTDHAWDSGELRDRGRFERVL